MSAFIFSIVFLVAGIVGGIVLMNVKVDVKKSVPSESGGLRTVISSEKKYAKFAAIPFAAGAVLFAGLLLSSVFTTVPTGHTGVVTVFGKVKEEVLDAGMHVKAPWEDVVNMDNRVQKATVNLSCFSSDIQEVECKYTLNYQIKKTNAQEIYRTVGSSYYDTVITPNVAESVKTIMAHYTAENLIGNRDDLARNIETLLGDQLDRYNIEVVSTAIEDMDFTDEFTAAVEAKQVAVQNKLKAQTEQEQKTMEATQEAERSKIEANAKAEIARIQAEADKVVAEIGADSAEYQGKKEAAIALQRLASINGWTVVTGDDGINKLYKADGSAVTSEELKVGTQKLIQYYYVEQWNGTLPETYVGDGSASTIILGKD